MAEEFIEVTIHPDGKVEYHVTGVQGMDCLAQTEGLNELLGGEVEARELAPEAYQEAQARAQGRLWQ